MTSPTKVTCIYSPRSNPIQHSIVNLVQEKLRTCTIENWPIADENWDATHLALIHENLVRSDVILIVADSHLVGGKCWSEVIPLIKFRVSRDNDCEIVVFNYQHLSNKRLNLPPTCSEWRPPRRTGRTLLSATELAEIGEYFDVLRGKIAAGLNRHIEASPKRSDSRELIMAQSQLIVVRAIQLGWPLTDLLNENGIALTYQSSRWTRDIIADVASGAVGIAIYNRGASLNAKRRGEQIIILGNVGSSMSGRHLYLLSRDKSLFGNSEAQIVQRMRGKTLAAPLSSDIFDNLLLLLGIDGEWLSANGVKLVDISADANIDEIRTTSADFVTGGQNVRFEAVAHGDYSEAINFLTMSKLSAAILSQNAANCVIGNRDTVGRLGERTIRLCLSSAWRAFEQRIGDKKFFGALCDDLWLDADKSITPDTIKKIVRLSYARGLE